MHYITCILYTTRISSYKSPRSEQPLLEAQNSDLECGGAPSEEGLRAVCDTATERVEEGMQGGEQVKNAQSLVVASNWNTILTLKPKIGEYSSFSGLCPLLLFLPRNETFCRGGKNKAKTTRRGDRGPWTTRRESR